MKRFVVVNGDTGKAVLVDADDDSEALKKTVRFLDRCSRSVVAVLVSDEPYGRVFGYDR